MQVSAASIAVKNTITRIKDKDRDTVITPRSANFRESATPAEKQVARNPAVYTASRRSSASFAPQESRTTSQKSTRTSRAGIAGFSIRCIIVWIAAAPS